MKKANHTEQRKSIMSSLIPTTTIFQAQSFSDTYLLSNKPPTKDGIYPSYRGFFKSCEINLKRKSIKSNEWTATFSSNGITLKSVATSENLTMRRLLDQMTVSGI